MLGDLFGTLLETLLELGRVVDIVLVRVVGIVVRRVSVLVVGSVVGRAV